MKDRIFAIYGASGFGREVMGVAKQQLLAEGYRGEIVYIDDNPSLREVGGTNVENYLEFLSANVKKKFVALAIADSSIRRQLAGKLIGDGIEMWSIKANNVVVLDNVTIGNGSILCPFVTLTSDISIGRFFHANLYSYIGHDCHIGDFVTFAPGVKCNGNVRIEDNVYIATGAIIRQGSNNRPIIIGEGAKVGMGAVVTKSVAPRVTVIGNPARPLSKDSLRTNMGR